MQTLKSSWRNWNRDDWNEALFLHFFYDSDGEDHPVHRIPVTTDELVKVVCDSGSNANEVQEAFIGVVRTTSHNEFNRRLSRYPIDSKTGWKGAEIPPFFVDLSFSCLAASPPDGEIRNDGDFRNRIAMLLDHDVSEASYPLGTLAPLWRAFSKWLDMRRSAGEPYRRLELPHLDHRVRIGYSINLAFPSRKDQIILTKVLSEGELEGDPPIPAVFDLVGSTINKFSTGFRRAYEEFRDAFRSRETNLEKYPFWGAVREAVKSVVDDEIGEGQNGDSRSLKLVIETGGVVLLLSTVPGDIVKNEVIFVEADTPYREFGSVFCRDPISDSGFYQATLKLLQGHFRGILSGRGWQAINVALEQGLLLFKKTENLCWELAFTRNEEGDYRALIKDYLAEAFLWALPKDRRPYPIPSQYRGWTELEHFPGEWLTSLTYADKSLLAKIRCLQPTVSGPRISLIGGCPVDGGFLGIPHCLPKVRAPLSDAVKVVSIDKEKAKEPIQLTRMEKESADFSFPNYLQDPIEGRYRVVGSLDDRVLVQKEVLFRPEIVVNAYARPTDPSIWEIEAGGPDVVTLGEDINGAPRQTEVNSRGAHSRSRKIVTTPRAADPLSLLKLTHSTWFHTKASASWTQRHSIQGSSNSVEAERLMEVCGGLAMRRKGIPEAEFLSLVEDYLSLDRYDLRWDVVRAWLEAGYLDRLHYKKWRRTEYFPRIPQFVLETREGLVRGVLGGLATAVFRKRADVELLELGADRKLAETRSEWIIPAPAWSAPSIDPFYKVSKTLGLEEPVWTKPLIETLWSLSDIVAPRESSPQYYERWSCWDWNRGGFFRDTEPIAEGVGIILFQRPDRPPYYQVTINGECIWWSTSRNWSLLLAYDLRGENPFILAGSNEVVRVSKGQMYLPLPVGRHLATTSSITPGPSSEGDGAYVYQFRDSKERLQFISAIWGNQGLDATEMRRWARWILALSRRPTLGPCDRVVPLPNHIRHGLERFCEVPEFRELSRTRINPSLLPHVKEALSRFNQSKRR